MAKAVRVIIATSPNTFLKVIANEYLLANLINSWLQGMQIIENINKSSDIEIIAFIQNTQTKEIFQANSVVESYTKGAADISKQLKNAFGTEDKLPATSISFGLYPNPAENKLKIEFSDNLQADADIRIYDLQGAIKKTYKVAMGESEFSIEDIGLKSGIYVVRVSSGGKDLGFTKLIITGE